jgi:hypothetical protein
MFIEMKSKILKIESQNLNFESKFHLKISKN